MLVSTVLNFNSFIGDQSMVNFLPTYATDAWYHGKVPEPKPDLMSWVAEAQGFRRRAVCLRASEGRRDHRVGEAVCCSANGAADRPVAGIHPSLEPAGPPDRFERELLRDRRQIIGRIDLRYVGTDADAAGERPSYDAQATRDHRRLCRRAERLSVPRSRLQDAAHATARTIMLASAKTGTSSTSRSTANSSPSTPASTWQRRCAGIHG